MCSLLLGFALLAADPPLPDARWLIEAVLAQRDCVEERRDAYTFQSRETKLELRRRQGGTARLARTRDRLWQVYPAGRRDLRRLLAEDGRPIDSDRAEREDARIAHGLEPAEVTHARTSERDLRLGDLLRHATLTTIERTREGGRSLLVVEVRGDRRARARSPTQKIIQALHGFLFIDEEDLQVARAEAEVGKVRFIGGIAGVLDQGSLYYEQARIDGEVWLPARSRIEYRGRLFVKRVDRLEVVESSGYERFETEVGVRFGG